MTALRVEIVTPLERVAELDGIESLRAEDASGDFGIKAGHSDLVTVIDAGVIRWRAPKSGWTYCVIRGGVLTVTGGELVSVACRFAVVGDHLPDLQAQVEKAQDDLADAARHRRASTAQLHARAIRSLMKGLVYGGDTLGLEGDE